MKYIFHVLLLFFIINMTPYAQTEKTDSTDIESVVLSLQELLNMSIDVASFKEQTIFNTPSTVSVIDKESIKRYNFTTISEALNSIAGFSVMRTYLKRNLPTSRGILQDHYANKVLVMINNVPTFHASTGEGNIDRISINDVERIEVLKGPASVLYGTNAYSGAINIVLKKPVIADLQSTLRVGSNGLISGGAVFTYKMKGYSLFISANSTTERGYDYLFTDQAKVKGHLNEYINSSNFTFSAKYSGHNILLNTYQVDESYLGVSPTFSAGAGKNHLLSGFLFNYSFDTPLSPNLDLQLKGTYDWNHRDLSRTFDDNTRAEITGQKMNGSVNLVYHPTDNLSIQLGGDYGQKVSLAYANYNVQKDSVLTDNYMKDESVYDLALLGQVNYTFSDFTLLLGMRYNKNEFFGGDVSTRGTLVYEIDNQNSLKLVYGTSYRAPSLFELYFRTTTNTVFGNTALEPEKSNSVELSYLTSFSNLFIQALVYRADYSDKIFRTRGDFTASDGTQFTNVNYYINGKKFSATGVEVEIKYQLHNEFDAFVNYSFIDGDNGDEINNDGHYNFNYVAQHMASAGFSKSFGALNISLLANYLSERNSTGAPLEAQTTFDANVGFYHYVMSFKIRHNISMKNIFDEIVLFPEYVGRSMNSVPSGFGRQILYSVGFEI